MVKKPPDKKPPDKMPPEDNPADRAGSVQDGFVVVSSNQKAKITVDALPGQTRFFGGTLVAT